MTSLIASYGPSSKNCPGPAYPLIRLCLYSQVYAGADPEIQIGAIITSKNLRNSFFHHDFVQFGKQNLRYKVILTSTALSQQCCDVYFMSLTVVIS